MRSAPISLWFNSARFALETSRLLVRESGSRVVSNEANSFCTGAKLRYGTSFLAFGVLIFFWGSDANLNASLSTSLLCFSTEVLIWSAFVLISSQYPVMVVYHSLKSKGRTSAFANLRVILPAVFAKATP